MAVSLVKGGNVSLTKEAPIMNVTTVSLGWDIRVTDGQGFDLDTSVFAVGKDGKVLPDAHFIFFNNKTSPDGAAEHQDDNRIGEGGGDDEQVKIGLTRVSADIKKLVFAITIYGAEARKQNFDVVSNSLMRVYNNDNGTKIARFDLSEDASTETATVFGELYRHGAEQKFKAVGQGPTGGPSASASQHGVNI